MKTKQLTFLLALTFVFLFCGSSVVFADFPHVKKNLFYTFNKGLTLLDRNEAAMYLNKAPSFWIIYIVNIYGEREVGSACIKKEYFMVESEQIVHGETYYYCKGFVSEQSIKINYMHLDRTYSVKGETLAWVFHLLERYFFCEGV
jgi:hypothetical protein